MNRFVAIGWLGLLCSVAGAAPAKKILVVMSSSDHVSLQEGKTYKTGFYLNELMVPLKKLMDAGYEPVFTNPKGNQPPMEAHSDTPASFGNDKKVYKAMKKLLAGLAGFKAPKPLANVAHGPLDEYVGLFVPGGHAPMEDLWADESLGKIFRVFHAAGKPTGLICHGPVALLSAKPGGEWPYKGYKMTVFSTAEEKSVEAGGPYDFLKGKMNFYAEEALRNAGGLVSVGPAGKSFVVRDRELITAQNPSSDAEFGTTLVAALKEAAPSN